VRRERGELRGKVGDKKSKKAGGEWRQFTFTQSLYLKVNESLTQRAQGREGHRGERCDYLARG